MDAKTYTCQSCGAGFERPSYPSWKEPKFCSRPCRDAARTTRVTLSCDACGATFERKRSHVWAHNFCSKLCADAKKSEAMRGVLAGSRNAHWKGGVIYIGGYRYVKRSGHPMARKNGYVAEHRLVLAEKLGRMLEPHEVGHHVNGDRLDNRPENLEATSQGAHSRHHRAIEGPRKGWGKHGECRECGTTAMRHYGHGLCTRCYQRGKSREYRAMRGRSEPTSD